MTTSKGMLSRESEVAQSARLAFTILHDQRRWTSSHAACQCVLESVCDAFGWDGAAYLAVDAQRVARLQVVSGQLDPALRQAFECIELTELGDLARACAVTLPAAESAHEHEGSRSLREALSASAIQSTVYVPVQEGARTRGVLVFFLRFPAALSDTRVDALQAAAAALGAGLERIAALEHAHERALLAELEWLVLRRIDAATMPSEAVRTAMVALREGLAYDHAVCWSTNGDAGQLEVMAQSGTAAQYLVQAMNAPDGSQARAATVCRSTGDLIVISELDDALFSGPVRDAGMRAALCLPLLARGEVAYVIELWSMRPESCSEARREALYRIGGTISTLLDRLEEREGLAWALRDFASELTDLSRALRATTVEQSASAQQLAGAVAQVSATLAQLRETSMQALRVAESVIAKAEGAFQTSASGRGTVERTIESMRTIREQVCTIAERIVELNHHTSQIDTIISTVNEISAQSKLLALNAAIEAARAGEHGRGFGVVASEIRSLAEQSKQATGDVRAILGEIQASTNAAVIAAEEGTKKSESGMALADLSGNKIQELASAMEQSRASARQIVDSASQQGAGIEQVAEALVSITNATNATAASLKHTEYTTEQLVALAERITQILLSLGPTGALPDGTQPANTNAA